MGSFQELKVGLMTIFALVIIAIFIFSLGVIEFGDYYRVKVQFNDIIGLNNGAKVTLGGVKIGKIEDINIIDTKVILTLMINQKYKIMKDAVFQIKTKGMMGELYVGIVTPKISNEFIKPGKLLTGVDPVSMDDLFRNSNVLILELHKTVISINDIFTDPMLRSTSRNIMKNVEKASENFKLLTKNIDDNIARLSQKFIVLNDNLDSIFSNFNEEFKNTKDDIRVIIKNVRVFSTNLKYISKENVDKVNKTIDSLSKTVDNINIFTEKIKNFTNIVDNKGETPKEVKSIITNTRKTIENLKNVTIKVNEIFEDKKIKKDLKKSINSFSNVSDKINTAFEEFKSTKVNYNLGLFRDQNNSQFISEFNVIAKRKENDILMGIYDAGNTNKLNFQHISPLSKRLGWKFGVFNSKIGIGADYDFRKTFKLSLDVIDTNDTVTDIKTEYKFTNDIDVSFRINDVFSKKAEKNYFVGIKKWF